jgi:hypothetical protein
MEPTMLYLMLVATCLCTTAMVALISLKGFMAWIDLKRAELQTGGAPSTSPSASNRIELADLKERLRKLEAIAAGVDL